MLLSRILSPPDTSSNSTAEDIDIFSSAHSLLFPDSYITQHGQAGSSIIYRSPTFHGHHDIELHLADPNIESERLLFAHYLWNASLVLAGLIEDGFSGDAGGRWDVKGHRVLELGAGM